MNEQKFIQEIMAKRDRLIDNSDKKYLSEFANNQDRRDSLQTIPLIMFYSDKLKSDKTGYAILLVLALLIFVISLVALVLFLRPSIDNSRTEVQQVFPTVYNNTVQEVVKRTEIVAPPGQSMICIDNPDTRVRTCYPQ